MSELRAMPNAGKAGFYCEVVKQLEALLGDERDPIANAANTAALLFHTLPDVNWVGFTSCATRAISSWDRSRESLPACASPMARACAAPQSCGGDRFWSRMFTPFPVTLPATQLPGPSLSCR